MPNENIVKRGFCSQCHEPSPWVRRRSDSNVACWRCGQPKPAEIENIDPVAPSTAPTTASAFPPGYEPVWSHPTSAEPDGESSDKDKANRQSPSALSSLASAVIIGVLVIVFRACDSSAPIPPPMAATPMPALTQPAPDPNSIDWDSSTREERTVFLLRMRAAQDKAEAERRQRSEIEDLRHEVDVLKQHAQCEVSYRSNENMYREAGLTLAQVCP